ncbi:MAG: sulfite exporter TauE/SafE family protein [Gemmatimonadetes bacterium]|nr:sulfite exporter TauE/SafE family protein [Gemmatimonadota bacterium]
MSFLLLLLLGVMVGSFGTLIGAGGGFLLVPALILLYPDERPETITSISLAVVFFNALSGSVAYARMKRIDYVSGIRFAVATIPGAVSGAIVTNYLPRRTFDQIFGVVLIIVGVALLIAGEKEPHEHPAEPVPGRTLRIVVEGDGTRHQFSYRSAVGIPLSVFVGFVSSLLGIGGGIIHVPALVYWLNFPTHIATATSHFILAFMALAGTTVHIADGALASGVQRAASLGLGALIGAQVGARMSERVHAKWIIRSLGLGLAFVGVRILLIR